MAPHGEDHSIFIENAFAPKENPKIATVRIR